MRKKKWDDLAVGRMAAEDDRAWAAVEYVKYKKVKERQWLFALAGILRGHCRTLTFTPEEAARAFSHSVNEFASLAIRYLDPTYEHVDWHDRSAVTLNFEYAWEQRKDVLEANFLEMAIEGSWHPLFPGLSNMEGWMGRIVKVVCPLLVGH